MIATERKLLQATIIPFSCHLSENSILGHLFPFVLAYGQLLDPTSAFIDKNVITRCCCSDSYRNRAIPGYYHPIFPPLAWRFNFWPFCLFCACFVPFCPLFLISPWVTFMMDIIRFSDVSLEMVIFPFLATLTPRNPLWRDGLTEWGFWRLYNRPQAILWT